MAVGLACMFGIWLPFNFNSPYKAYNIIEFWRRWHMTLSRFFRDYLYIPLGGNRGGHFPKFINISITMLLGGLWHGAAWTFVVWGGMHGVCLIINHLWQNFRKKLGHDLSKCTLYGKWFGRLLTFFVISVLWVIFRAENLSVALTIIKSMFGFNSFSGVFSTGIQHNSDRLIACLVIVWFAPNMQQVMFRYIPESYNMDQDYLKSKLRIEWVPNSYWAIFISLFAIASILNLTRLNEFLYFQF
jgi:D-alanyl-lipoteichoic acid acyltransferase DltB (MBOAT superfamily)